MTAQKYCVHVIAKHSMILYYEQPNQSGWWSKHSSEQFTVQILQNLLQEVVDFCRIWNKPNTLIIITYKAYMYQSLSKSKHLGEGGVLENEGKTLPRSKCQTINYSFASIIDLTDSAPSQYQVMRVT